MINLKQKFINNSKIRYFVSLMAFISTAMFAVSHINHLLTSPNPIGIVYYLSTITLMIIFTISSAKLKNKQASIVLIPFNIISIAFIFDSSPILHFLIEGRNNIFSSPLVLDMFSIVSIIVTLCLIVVFTLFLTRGVYRNLVLYLSIFHISLLIIQQVYNYIIYEVYYFPWSYLYKALFYFSVFLLAYSIREDT